ncbi:MAG: bifunctional phosphoribosylaminoimidazolecarboxamide formyltransferase/IMP cyclohydrolase [Acidobacteriota bacterium]
MTAGGRRALISVFDKTGVVDLARRLASLGYAILSSGGTAEALRAAGLRPVEISEDTGHPEILGGRVKTLHPRVHGGILADPALESHRADLERTGIEPIDLVVVNLYPFREVAARPDAGLDALIEMIDIGGPALVRAAAKNHRRVGVVVDPADYPAVLEELESRGALSGRTRAALAVKAFARTAAYDAAVRDELSARTGAAGPAPGGPGREGPFPSDVRIELRLIRRLRYGENPHQRGALYAGADAGPGTVGGARPIQGKELSFNNLLDLDAAWRLVRELSGPAAAIVKHNNPCGAAIGPTLLQAFEDARRTDPASAFGGIVAFNRELDADAAEPLLSLFLECVIAPSVTPAAREVLGGKPNLRVLEAGDPTAALAGTDLRRVSGGYLMQDWDAAEVDVRRARVVTRRAPGAEELVALDFAWRVAKHTRSNAIVLARGERTVGVGAGQMSRVDAVKLAKMKALEPTEGCVLASDAFFPFPDGVDAAARAGVVAIVQPGGSVRDSEVVAAADRRGLAMVFTGVRHFRH